MRVTLQVLVIPNRGESFLAKREVDLPFLCVGMTIYGARYRSPESDFTEDEVELVYCDLDQPGLLVAKLTKDDMSDYGPVTFEEITQGEYRDWRVEDHISF